MAYRIDEIEGIGPANKAKLEAAGVSNTDQLLEKAASKAGRKALAAETGIDEKRILTFVNLADLMRVKGIGRQFAELLQAAGVDTIKELRTRKAANLAAAVAATNAEKKLAKAVPSESQIEGFIEAAKGMEPTVTH
jgi:predicted flap endonuclease-1-like 5' DNA nuclease